VFDRVYTELARRTQMYSHMERTADILSKPCGTRACTNSLVKCLTTSTDRMLFGHDALTIQKMAQPPRPLNCSWAPHVPGVLAMFNLTLRSVIRTERHQDRSKQEVASTSSK